MKKKIHSSYCFCSVFHPFVTAKLYGTISDDTLLYPYSAVLLANCGALMVGCLRFVLCFIALLSNSKEAVTSCFVLVLCFLKSQCEFAVTASYSVNTLRMIWAVWWCRWWPFWTCVESAHRMRQAMTTELKKTPHPILKGFLWLHRHMITFSGSHSRKNQLILYGS